MPGRTECVHNTVKCNDQNQKMKMLGIVWIEKLIFKTMKFSLNTTLISIELNFKFLAPTGALEEAILYVRACVTFLKEHCK